jgi:hypothetical protein
LTKLFRQAVTIIYISPLLSPPLQKGKLRILGSQLEPKRFPGQTPDGIPKIRPMNGLDTTSFTSPLRV